MTDIPAPKELYVECPTCGGLGDVMVPLMRRGVAVRGTTDRVLCPTCEGRRVAKFGMTVEEVEKLRTDVMNLRSEVATLRRGFAPSRPVFKLPRCLEFKTWFS